MHTYTVVWAPRSIVWSVDGEVVLVTNGTTSTIPYTAGNTLAILRPKDTKYLGDSAFTIRSMSYDEAF